VTLYLTEEEVAGLLTIEEAIEAVEQCFLRLARGVIDNRPRTRLPLDDGQLAVMAAVDSELGLAGLKSYAWLPGGTPFVVVVFDTAAATLAGVLEADRLGRLRTGAASGVAAKHLARQGAATLGVLGCGRQAVTQVAAIRAAVPTVERALAYCRDEKRLAAFCKENGCEPAESHREAAAQEIVVTVTTSQDPVLRGEWLEEGALVCAVGANHPAARELDNVVLERASFVCCDSRDQARLESGDLIEPVERGVLDWLEVHELQEVVAGEVPGRQADEDIVLFKSNGIAAWDIAVAARVLERARELGVGRELGVAP
jgi:ornithine cyclodeaminase/alanine dehydrogenase